MFGVTYGAKLGETIVFVKDERALSRLPPVDISDQGEDAGAHEARFIAWNIAVMPDGTYAERSYR